jgi:hypothetical protein
MVRPIAFAVLARQFILVGTNNPEAGATLDGNEMEEAGAEGQGGTRSNQRAIRAHALASEFQPSWDQALLVGPGPRC